MKARTPERMIRVAAAAARRRARKAGRALSRQELLRLKLQLVPAPLRLLLGITGTTAVICGATGWPWDAEAVRAAEIIAGILLIVFGIYGIRRTLSRIADGMSHELLEAVIDRITDSIDL